ncbi:hypothetical protein PAAG_11485 [Paracoccidioides lutzii Pb01]|uniref:Uncharacterized protein n=1 Tax=Paracoccidioides lutzii (strain ATCC MYA-826 / Pb01) TaxID=502779 RepID=A0A0A2VLN9_PARBA|nr:hypothetical protein PAAG_11485 [Paracoccidioides lutzii Pb01]KGQ01764.1 hypothetical protein PAAG_11485 [Paracoccidioides lutzii Pb01]
MSASPKHTVELELEKDMWNLLDTAKCHPITLGGFVLDHTTFKSARQASLYRPFFWPALTMAIDMLLPGNISDPATLLQDVCGPGQSNDKALRTILSLIGIYCLDRVPLTSPCDDVLPVVNQLYKTSRMMGSASVSLNMNVSAAIGIAWCLNLIYTLFANNSAWLHRPAVKLYLRKASAYLEHGTLSEPRDAYDDMSKFRDLLSNSGGWLEGDVGR